MADDDGKEFVRPRVLLPLAPAGSSLARVELVRCILEDSGFSVDAAAAGIDAAAEAEGCRPTLVVSADRARLEAEAERLALLKPHDALPAHVEGQAPGKIQFEARDKGWTERYLAYNTHGFWSSAEKVYLLRSALDRVSIDTASANKLGVSDAQAGAAGRHLISALRISAVLQDVVTLDDNPSDQKCLLWKRELFSAVPSSFAVNDYFGPRVALYFAWMRSFSRALLLPALVGPLVTAHMAASGQTVDDYPYMPFFSLGVVLWAAGFVSMWDRSAAELSWRWGVHGEGRGEQEIRPSFVGVLRTSRATGLPERHAPHWERLVAYLRSGLVTLAMLAAAFAVMLCSLNLQGYMARDATNIERAFYVPALADLAQPGALLDPRQTEYFGLLTYLPTLMHVGVIQYLNRLYRGIAVKLTDAENHRLEEDYQNSLITKRFLFEAFDCYVSLFYVAFVQQDARKLRTELRKLYLVDSLRRVMLETVLPLARLRFGRNPIQSKSDKLKKIDQSHHIESTEACGRPDYDQFEDFLEMSIQFGYITLFADVFPLAGLLSLVSNLVEVKSDLCKLVFVCRRPPATRCSNIGAWRGIMRAMVAVSVVTNVAIFAVSEQLASWAPTLYREAESGDVTAGRVARIEDLERGTPDLVLRRSGGLHAACITVAAEHLVGLAALAICLAVPARPRWVEDEIRRTALWRESPEGHGPSSLRPARG